MRLLLQISDLLKPERNNLTIREDKKKGVFVDQLSEWVVRSPAEIYGLMERGGQERATGETKMNEYSSRSHAVFIVIAEQSETLYVDDRGKEMSPEEFQKFMHSRGVRREQEMNKLEDHVRQSFKVGKLNLVDLAGSERVRLSGATGQRLEECKQINSSLSHLGFVISALTDPKNRQHIPYRNSKLTRMLEDSLGGNCKTTMMAMVSPAFESMLETVSTLKFANRAKNIRNEARVNEDLDQKSLLRKYERELKQLRAELEERSKNVVDKRRLLELDDQRRRAEADKMAALRELEARSVEFMHEKEEKKKLEARIASLMGQMIRGERSGHGAMPGDGASSLNPDGSAPELHEMMKEQQDKLRQEYESKLAGLERERETIEEEKAQVDRYKQLLLKQRDIMIALTQRLVERDEQIMSLQDELDAYDRHHKELEEKLDEKTAMLIKFQRISMEVNASSPVKSEELGKAMDSWARAEGSRRSGATEVLADSDSPQGSGAATAELEEKLRSLTAVLSSQRAKISALEAQIGEGRNGASHDRAAQSELDVARSEIIALKARSQQLEASGGGGDKADLQVRDHSLSLSEHTVNGLLLSPGAVLEADGGPRGHPDHRRAQDQGARAQRGAGRQRGHQQLAAERGRHGSGSGEGLACSLLTVRLLTTNYLLQSIDDLRSLVDASIKAMRNNAASANSNGSGSGGSSDFKPSNGASSGYLPQPPAAYSGSNGTSAGYKPQQQQQFGVGTATSEAGRFSVNSSGPGSNSLASTGHPAVNVNGASGYRPPSYDPVGGGALSTPYSSRPGGEYRPVPSFASGSEGGSSVAPATSYTPLSTAGGSYRPLASLPSPARSAPQIPFSAGNGPDPSSGGTILSRHYQQQQQQQQLLSSGRGGASQEGGASYGSGSSYLPAPTDRALGASGAGSAGLYSSVRR